MLENSKWVGLPENEECKCPKFVRTVDFDGKLKSAVLCVTSIGVCECRIDGEKLGDGVLAPGWTSYENHVQCEVFDVTEKIKKDSVIEVCCGNGWACGVMGWDIEDNVYSKNILCKYSLHLKFSDGTETEIVSDEETEVWTSKTLSSDIYHGEIIDNTVIERKIGNAKIYEFDTRLDVCLGEKITEHERIYPADFIVTPKGEKVLDFGQNITGYVEVRIKGNKGDRISFRHAEILDKNGNIYNENYRSAKNEITYVCDGEENVFKPSFSFQGFRYICIDEYPGEVNPNNFTAIEVHSDINRTGNFVCGFDKLNILYNNIIWGQKDNFLDIPTDCPQRDERLGWTGDAQVFVRTAAINFDVEKFFEKWLTDVRYDQREDGSVPSVIPDCLREYHVRKSAAWADASVICPWEIYRAYGNEKILSDNFECMRRWIEYMHGAGDEEFLWLGGYHYGDWLAMDNGDSWEGATDKDFIASCFFAYSTSLFIKAGKVLGKGMSDYEEMYSKIVSAIKERFTKDGLPTSRTQTACALMIYFDLCDDAEKVGNLLSELIDENNGHLTTGFVGTPYLLHALSQTGNTKAAYDLLLNEGYPSWLYSVNRGATTMWEHWDGVKEDGSFWDKAMNSYNHYAYGSVYDWMFKYIGGIDIAEGGEGYSKVLIAPLPDKRLGFASTSINTRRGEISSSWRYRDGFVRYEIEIPKNTVAEIKLVDGKKYCVCGGRHIFHTKAD